MTAPRTQETLFLSVAGSHAHGTARPGSDIDVRGICVQPLAQRVSPFHTFAQYEGVLEGDLAAAALPGLARHSSAAASLGATKQECVVFDVAKFVVLCSQANPNALEILFSDERDWLLESPRWRRLHGARHQFLTRQLRQTFLGYAQAQLRRVRTHRSWLLDPPVAPPRREDFGLPAKRALGGDEQGRLEAAIARRMQGHDLDDLDMPPATRLAVQERWRALVADVVGDQGGPDDALRRVAGTALGLPREVLEVLGAERRYLGAAKQWEAYLHWKATRNPERAALERRFGYDTKHAAHLVRLMRMAGEALQSGDLRVRRPDADELRSIREGSLTFDALTELAASLEVTVDRAFAGTSLPEAVDRASVEDLLVELILS